MTKKDMEIRCARLGGPVPFSYCEKAGHDGQPCFKVADCWWQHFDVVAYLKQRLTAEELREVLERRPQPKLTGILEIIQQACQNSSADDRGE